MLDILSDRRFHKVPMVLRGPGVWSLACPGRLSPPGCPLVCCRDCQAMQRLLASIMVTQVVAAGVMSTCMLGSPWSHSG
jgi:hypothetical protein